jgi:nitroimidazol reductase NimA-like FMN-containing flavoprotein (pyridoxamine 5'-phosphate oxidase superfamily)
MNDSRHSNCYKCFLVLKKSYIMLGQLNKTEIEHLLVHQVVGRIGCHANGTTYVVPISYAYDGESVYCHTHEGLKTRIMGENKNVCFQVDQMQNMANWQSVISQGEYEEVTDKTEREKALKLLLNRILPLISSETVHLTPQWPFIPEDVNSIKGVVFRIRLLEKSGRYENNGFFPQA